MRHRMVLSMVVLFALASPVFGQQQEGDTELQLQGSLRLATSSDFEHSGGANVTYGRFVTDRQEWGVTATATFTEDGDLGGTAGPFYRYNFGTGETVPFVGAAAVASFGDDSFGDNALLSAEGGVRFFLDRNRAFTVTGQTFYSIEESEFADSLNVLFGFSVFWSK